MLPTSPTQKPKLKFLIVSRTGYTTNVLGVENHCRFKHISTVPQSYYEVEVVPCLPLLRVKTSLPQALSTLSLDPNDSKTNTSAAVSLFQGERYLTWPSGLQYHTGLWGLDGSRFITACMGLLVMAYSITQVYGDWMEAVS